MNIPIAWGMNKISKPTVLKYEAPQEEDSGLSGFVVIAESHISVHTFPERNYVNIDIFSCKAFDSERTLEDIKHIFGLLRVKSWVVERGLEHYDPQCSCPERLGPTSLIQAAFKRNTVPTAGNSPWIPFNFLALPKEDSSLASARVALIPVPYDSTTSYRTGS